MQESNFEETIWTIDITNKIGKEYVAMMNDIARFVTIQFTIQLLLFTMDGKSFSMFTLDFILLLMFITVGVMFYWLVIRKLVSFK